MPSPTLQPLTPEEKAVIINKQTEAPYTGEYEHFWQAGVYLCRQCLTPLYRSSDKFDAACGWPSFDQELPGAVTKQLDRDGHRFEITCTTCGGHLGHVFEGEHLTDKNVRHCVNSISLKFKAASAAYFGGGCFWCTEAVFSLLKGVISVTPGYAGGHTKNPTYFAVSESETGHAEVIEVLYDEAEVSYQDLLDVFFHTHNPTTLNRQGADVGTQYRSIILTTSPEQSAQAQEYKKQLNLDNEFDQPIVTEIKGLEKFYPTEPEHLKYYQRHRDQQYCQVVIDPKMKSFRERYQRLLANSAPIPE